MTEQARLEGVIALVGLQPAISELRRLSREFDQTGKQADKSTGGMAKRIKTLGDNSTQAGQKLTRNLTVPIAGLAGLSFHAFGNFDQTIRQVGVAADVTGKDLEDMRRLAMKMGADTSFSAGQAAAAMLELAKGGMTAAQIKGGGLEQTLTLAAAGQIELGEAATYVANTLNMYGLKADKAKVVTAALAGGAQASTASVGSLGQALAQSGQQATMAGLDINETVGYLAMFDQAGLKGSDSGTSFKTMLSRLVPTTAEAADEMKRLNLSFVDSKGAFVPANEIAERMQKTFKGMSEEQRTQSLLTIFGTDAMRAANITVDRGVKGLKPYITATKDLAAAQQMAKTNTEGAKGGIEQMIGSLETAGITAGSILAPHVISLAGHVTDAANAFGRLDSETQATILTFAGLAAASGPAMMMFGSMTNGAMMAGNGARLLGTGLGNVAMRAGNAIPALASLSLVMASNPMITGAVAIAATGAAIYGIVRALDDGADSAREAAAATKSYEDSIRSLADSQLAQTDAAFGVIDAHHRVRDANQAARQAEREFGKGSQEAKAAAYEKEKAYHQLRTATEGYNKSIKGSIDAGDKNRKQMLDEVDKVSRLTKARDEAASTLKRHQDYLRNTVATPSNQDSRAVAQRGIKEQSDALRLAEQDLAKHQSRLADLRAKGSADLQRRVTEAKRIYRETGRVMPGMEQYITGLKKGGDKAQAEATKAKDKANRELAKTGQGVKVDTSSISSVGRTIGLALVGAAQAIASQHPVRLRATHGPLLSEQGTKHATGGYISGPGTGTSDSIPAWLSDGEYVINAKSTSKYLPMLEAINKGKMQGFKSGGRVKKKPTEVGANAWMKLQNQWSLREAKANLAISTPGNERGDLLAAANLYTAEAKRYRKFLRVHPGRLDASTQASIYQAIASAQDSAKRYAEEANGGSSSGGGGDQTLAAQLEMQRQRAETAEMNFRISQAQYGVLSGSGDIGSGGANAAQAARGGNVTNVYTLHPGSPQVMQAIQEANGAAGTQGRMANRIYSGRRSLRT